MNLGEIFRSFTRSMKFNRFVKMRLKRGYETQTEVKCETEKKGERTNGAEKTISRSNLNEVQRMVNDSKVEGERILNE